MRAQIPPHRAAGYFYRRSADLAARGDLPSALAEAERGLGFVESSELRLLAAILAKRTGDVDTVRGHVSAIPVDDRLRQEAEWLIRSQPRRPDSPGSQPPSAAYGAQPSGRPSTPGQQSVAPQNVRAAVPPASQAVPSASQHRAADAPESRNAASPASPANPTTPAIPPSALWAQRIWGFVALIMLIIAGAMGWTLVSGGPDALLALVPGLVEGTPNRIEAEPSLQPVTPVPLVLPTPTPDGGALIPNDLVLVVTPEPLVQLSPETPDMPETPFDLPAVLEAAGRSDLLSLPLNASVEGDRVRVTGIVTSTVERLAIIDLVQQVSGVREVYAAELLVRIPPTYTVQEGDSLWSIANQFYGPEESNVSLLFDANRDVLPSAQSLQVGMVLRLPPAP